METSPEVTSTSLETLIAASAALDDARTAQVLADRNHNDALARFQTLLHGLSAEQLADARQNSVIDRQIEVTAGRSS